MASKYWIKLYHEILDDPKMGMMTPELWQRTVQLFLVAGEYDQNGLLPPVQQLAWRLRLGNEECNETLHKLLQCNIIAVTDDEKFIVKNFQKRQKASDGAERVRQYRERKAPKQAKRGNSSNEQSVTNMKRNGNENVTKRYPDTDKESVSKDSEKISQRRKLKGNKQPETVGPKTIVRNKFFELTQLSEPPKKTMGTWWGWISELLTIGQSDPIKTCHIMETVIVYMRNEHLTITSPKSIINLARTLASGQELVSKNGNQSQSSRASPPKVGDFDQERYERLKRGEQ